MPRSSVTGRIDASYDVVRSCLMEAPEDLWIADGETAPVMRAELPMGVEVHHNVDVTMDSFYELSEPFLVCGRDIHIDASGHDRLFPTFDGSLEVYPSGSATKIELAGTYHLPTGLLGRAVDAVLLGKLAYATLADLFGVALQRLTLCTAIHVEHD